MLVSSVSALRCRAVFRPRFIGKEHEPCGGWNGGDASNGNFKCCEGHDASSFEHHSVRLAPPWKNLIQSRRATATDLLAFGELVVHVNLLFDD